MPRRVLVTGAGSGASNNVVRSLRTGDGALVIVGCHTNRFVLTRSAADRNYLVPAAPGVVAGWRRVIEAEGIDLLLPTTDADVQTAVKHRRALGGRTFLPRPAVVELCADKYRLTQALARHGVRVPRTVPVRSLARVKDAYQRLGATGPVWCRARRGSGSLGALPVRRAEQARAWIAYWSEMRGIPAATFTLSEYLPGRDFACQTLWRDGTLVLAKAFQRLEYFVGGGQPSGVSSVASLARTVSDPRPVETAVAAVRAIDARASGLFSVDMKENVHGEPCVTEINAGRFLAGTNILDLTGKHNMAATYVRLALGEPHGIRDPHDATDDEYMVRDLDVPPGILHANALFDAIIDVRQTPPALHPTRTRRGNRAVHR